MGLSLFMVGSVLLGLPAPPPVAAQNTQLDQWAIRNVTLVDGRGGPTVSDAVVILDRGRIRCAGAAPRCPLWGVPSVIDGTGLWVVPGLVDTHAHLDWSADSAAVQEAQLVRFALGVTTVREAGTHQVVANLRARERAADPYSPEPRLVVAGSVVPINKEKFGAPDYPALADTLIRRGVDQLKIKVRLEPEDQDGVFAAARRARVPVYGHGWEGPPPTTFVDEMLDRGAAGLSHLDAFSAIAVADVDTTPEAPNPDEDLDAWWEWRKSLWVHADSAVLDGIIESMVSAGAYLEPTLALERYWGATPPVPEELGFLGGIPRLSDLIPFRDAADVRARRAAFERGEASYEAMRLFVGRFHEAGGTVLAGPDNLPPGIGLHEELRLLEEAGVPSARLVTTSTYDAARMLGVSARVGTIEGGKLADLLLLEADPTASIGAMDQIWRVVKGGVVYDPDVLLEPLRLRFERQEREAWRARARRTVTPLLVLLAALVGAVGWWRFRTRW